MSRHSWNDQHIQQAVWAILRAFYGTAGIYVAVFVIFHISSALYVSHLSAHTTSSLRTGVAADLAYLQVQGDAVAQNPQLIKDLSSVDLLDLQMVMQEEKTQRSIGLMGVANTEGVILSRTKTVSKVGDNVFLTTPQGRAVSDGKSIQSVEISGVDPTQLILITGRPILWQGKFLGALFANYLTDDSYATRFRDTYLSKDMQVLFYTKQYGVYGDSFTSVDTRQVINSYFNPGSDWIQNGATNQTLYLNGTYYLVINVQLPGLEGTKGGAIIFVPRKDISKFINNATALITLLIFLALALAYHLRSRGEERGWRYYLLLATASALIFALTISILQLRNLSFLSLQKVPYILYNSTLRLQPEWGIYNLGTDQQFTIVADTGDEAINAIQVSIKYDPQAIDVKSLVVASSTCSYIIENTIDAAAGTAQLSCVILNSLEGRKSIPVADIIVSPKRSGIFNLTFDNDKTKILAADGLGTNVLRESQSGSYSVDVFDPSVSGSNSTSTKGSAFIIFSTTHPNQSRWYDLSTAHFVWQGKAGAVYVYAFDANPNTNPSDDQSTQANNVDLSIPGDGVFYFHLRLASGGPVTHYRIQSDTTPPQIRAMNASSNRINVGDTVRFTFSAYDASSGIQRNYYIDTGNNLFLPVGSQLFIPFRQTGDQKVTLRVYDEAGNYSEKSQIIHVEAK